MVYLIAMPLAWVIWHIVFNFKVIGRENLIKDRGFVMVCNHISAIDPVFLILARFWGKKMIVLGKKEIMKNGFARWFLKSVGVIAVDRGAGDTAALEKAVEQVKNGRGALIFPEGTRSKDGNLHALKSGAFVIAGQAQVDIIPSRIIYKKGKMKLFSSVKVVFGKPISCAELNLDGSHSASQLRGAKQRVTAEMEKLLEENKWK